MQSESAVFCPFSCIATWGKEGIGIVCKIVEV